MKHLRTLQFLIMFALTIGSFYSCSKDDNDEPNSQVVPPNNGNSSDNNGNSSDNNGNSDKQPTTGLKEIDLGLSVKWANMNVGATIMEGFGDLYAWGETSTKSTFERSNHQYFHTGYKDKDGVTIDSMFYDRIGNEVFIEYDNKQYPSYDISNTKYDVAHVKWGGKWRMPTYKELKELRDNCTWKWASINDVYGYKVTGKNGNFIFLPASGYGGKEGRKDQNKGGYYMSSTLVDQQHLTMKSSDVKEWGFYGIDFGSKEIYFGEEGRMWGFSVRPVSD